MERTWRSEKDDGQYEPKFSTAVDAEMISAVLTFVDADRSGTLELSELRTAFSWANRFDPFSMRNDRAVIVLERILPRMRKEGTAFTLRDFTGGFATGRELASRSTIIQNCLKYGLEEEEAIDASIGLDPLGEGTSTRDLKAAFRLAVEEVRKREARRARADRLDEERKKARDKAHAHHVKEKAAQHTYKRADVAEAFEFLDNGGEGTVDIEETLRAFGRAKRAKVEERMQAKGKKLLEQLFEVVEEHGLSKVDWFNSMDTSFKRNHM